MAWKDKREDWAGRLNPYLARVAVGLAMVVVLMAYQNRGSPRLAPSVQSHPPMIDLGEVRSWRTD